MRNVKLTIEYDGSNYFGWQVQENLPTIQGKLKEAIRTITGEDVKITGASRTDAGVHALGQVANFLTGSNMDCSRMRRALNALLPHDIKVTNVEDVEMDFDSRRNARGKLYLYRIFNRDTPSPFEYRRSWFIRGEVDVESMRRASRYLIGTHDFSAFSKSDRKRKTTPIRTIKSIDIERKGNVITFSFLGESFLRHMVRVIVATLVEVGMGRLNPEDVKVILSSKDRRFAPFLAKPYGLYLVKVFYEKLP